MITATLTDTMDTITLPDIEVPLTETIIEGSVDVTTLDMNMFTDFTDTKKQWRFTYDTLTEAQYNELAAFYTRQFSLLDVPELSIDYYSIEDVPVRMYLNPKNVYDHCGSVENVEVVFRQTIHNTSGTSS